MYWAILLVVVRLRPRKLLGKRGEWSAPSMSIRPSERSDAKKRLRMEKNDVTVRTIRSSQPGEIFESQRRWVSTSLSETITQYQNVCQEQSIRPVITLSVPRCSPYRCITPSSAHSNAHTTARVFRFRFDCSFFLSRIRYRTGPSDYDLTTQT